MIVKIGSASLVGPSGSLDADAMGAICREIAALKADGVKVVLVSSGAIAAGLGPLGLDRRPADIPSLQAAAAVGQGRLLERWSALLQSNGLICAQMLLTRYDFMQRQQYVNARHTLDRLLELDAVPVVNENDTIAVDEISFGDNDRLAALVGNLARAKLLVLLTDAKGVHARDPRKDPTAPILDEVEKITREIEAAAGSGRSEFGSGGMASKIAAAWVATFSGVATVVAQATEPDILQRVAAGDSIGTYFHPRATAVTARRLWIAFAQPPRGSVRVDDGARRALHKGNASLLPVGVLGVDGDFQPGHTVDIEDTGGSRFARGLVRYSSQDLSAARGRSTTELGGKEVVHRDELVLLHDEPSEDAQMRDSYGLS
jgi:glutamate 5-kinase